jgi:hypothetical protein
MLVLDKGDKFLAVARRVGNGNRAKDFRMQWLAKNGQGDHGLVFWCATEQESEQQVYFWVTKSILDRKLPKGHTWKEYGSDLVLKRVLAVCQMPLTEEGHLHQSDVAVFKSFLQPEGECFQSDALLPMCAEISPQGH